ncbi:MAG: EI24 domain-containing protein [Bacteroidota bacterium]
MIRGIFQGIRGFTGAWTLMNRHRLWSYALIPGLISAVLALGIFGGAFYFSGDVGDWLVSWYPADWWGASWVSSVAATLALGLVVIAALFLFKYIVMVVISPFMAILSEKIEHTLEGTQPPPTTAGRFIKDLIRGLRIALRNVFRELLYVGLLSLAGLLFGSLIPVIGGILPTVLIFVIQAYFAGFGNMDYTLERYRFGVKDSIRFVDSQRGLAIGNGGAFNLMLLIPVLGWFLAPVLGTVGATTELLKKGMEKHAPVR